MEDFINLIVNNGIGVACIGYFMYRDYKFMQKISDLLSALNATLDQLRGLEDEKQ